MCCVEVATPPIQVPLIQEHQKDESAPCLTVRDRSNLSTVSMNDVSDVASLNTLKSHTSRALSLSPDKLLARVLKLLKEYSSWKDIVVHSVETETWYYDTSHPTPVGSHVVNFTSKISFRNFHFVNFRSEISFRKFSFVFLVPKVSLGKFRFINFTS